MNVRLAGWMTSFKCKLVRRWFCNPNSTTLGAEPRRVFRAVRNTGERA